jgi:hypothetical protein
VIILHVELIGTNGTIQKRILWFSVTSNGVYSGYCWKNRDFHTTYHFDGNVFINWSNQKPKKTVTLPSLTELDSCHQLYSTGFSPNLERMHECPPYNLKKLDAILNIDTRAYVRGIGVSFFIFPQNRPDLIPNMVRFPETKTEAHFFLNCNPWIGIVLYGNIYETEQNT